jgi:hypothetical protein
MQAKNEISEELRSLSTVIDAISRDMPYGLPAGYFGDFPGLVLNKVQGISANRIMSAPFDIPQGYFEGLVGGIMARIKAGAGADLSGAFLSGADIPESAAAELDRLSPVLSRIGRTTPYRLPEGYFEELTPILAGLQHKSLYAVPEGYFDGLADKIVAKVNRPVDAVAKGPAEAKVVSMGSRKSWWRYSAAAVVAALVLTIGWLRLHRSPLPGENIAKTVNVADGLVKLSDQDLQNYLETDNVPLAETVTNSTATLDMDDIDVNGLLGDVPDGELKQYMEEHGGLKDNATN